MGCPLWGVGEVSGVGRAGPCGYCVHRENVASLFEECRCEVVVKVGQGKVCPFEGMARVGWGWLGMG